MADKPQEALETYKAALEGLTDIPVKKEIYRKMAPLYMKVEDYWQSIVCFNSVLDLETDANARAVLLTKIAGNYKKLGDMEKCVAAAKQVYFLLSVNNERNLQACRALINLAGIYVHFEQTEEASITYKQFLEIFNESKTMPNDPNFVKLRDTAEEQLESLLGGD